MKAKTKKKKIDIKNCKRKLSDGRGQKDCHIFPILDEVTSEEEEIWPLR